MEILLVEIFLVLIVTWFLYAFFRFLQELLRGPGDTGPVETGPAAGCKNGKRDGVRGFGKRYS